MNNESETYVPGHLLAELLDPNVPKNEREHFAAREIERLRNLLVRAGAIRDISSPRRTRARRATTRRE